MRQRGKIYRSVWDFIKKYYMPLAILLAGITGATLIVRHKLQATPLAQTIVRDCVTEKKTSDFACWNQRLSELTTQESTDAAFTDLKQQYQTYPYVVAECHQLAHRIGRAAVKKYPKVFDAFNHGDNFCWSGYYHGVMEAISTKLGHDQTIAKMNDICADLRKQRPYSFYHYNCVHGLGHGVMGITDNQLFDSLTICDRLGDKWERTSCYGGVFMENVMSEDNPDHRTSFLHKDQPMYPCTAVDTVYKEQCYLMQSSYALKLDGYDFFKVFGECAVVDQDFVATCYQSVGRDASGSSTSDVTSTNTTCNLGQTAVAKSNCVIGAVKDFISYYHDDAKAKLLCDSFASDQSLVDVCRSTATDYYKSF